MSTDNKSGPTLTFIPQVDSSIATGSFTAESVAEAREALKRERAPLYQELDNLLIEGMSLVAVLGGCNHCVALNGLAIFYSRLKQQVEANALAELAKL